MKWSVVATKNHESNESMNHVKNQFNFRKRVIFAHLLKIKN